MVQALFEGFDFFGMGLAEVFGFADVFAQVVEGGGVGTGGFLGGICAIDGIALIEEQFPIALGEGLGFAGFSVPVEEFGARMFCGFSGESIKHIHAIDDGLAFAVFLQIDSRRATKGW